MEKLEEFGFYESHYGVDIDFHYESKNYVACVWSEETQRNRDFFSKDLEEIKTSINAVLVKNFFDSLTEIKDHFKHTGDFNNPQQNLENLRLAASKKVKELLEDIL